MHARFAFCLLLLGACKQAAPDDPDALTPDGSSPDAVIDANAIDANAIDAMVGAVSVAATTREGAPDPGVIVIGHDAGGEPIVTATTDATGTATVQVPAGGIVTVIFSPCDDHFENCLRSFGGVVPGDSIHVIHPTNTEPARFNTRIEIPGVFAGANSYVFSNGCWSETSSTNYIVNVSRYLTTGCFNDPANPRLQAMGIARANGVPIAFARHLDADVPTGTQTILLNPWSDATTPYGMTFEDLADTTQWALSVRERMGFASHPLMATDTTSRAPLTAVRPAEPGTGVLVSIAARLSDNATTLYRYHYGPANETSFVIKNASRPMFTNATASLPNGRVEVSWSIAPDPGDVDAVMASVDGDNAAGEVRWTFFTAPGSVIRFPRLPADLALHGPITWLGQARLDMRLYGSTAWNGFADAHGDFLRSMYDSPYVPGDERDTQEIAVSQPL